MMQPFVARPSLWRMILLWLGSVAFVVLGAWFAGLLGGTPPPGALWVGWLGMAFFGLCALILFPRLFDRDAQVRISAQGIMFKNWSTDTVLWSEITDVTVWEMHGQRSIILHLRDPSRYPSTGVLGKLADINRAMTGGGDIPVQLTGTDGNFDQAMAAIEYFRRAGTPRR